MTKPGSEVAAQAAVSSLLRARKMQALALAVLVASTSATSGCTFVPHNQPCPGITSSEPCVQPSGDETSWGAPPTWPAPESGPGGSGGQHLASHADFIANPQYTQLRAGQGGTSTVGSGPAYYGGGHSYFIHTYGGGWSGGGSGGSYGGVSG